LSAQLITDKTITAAESGYKFGGMLDLLEPNQLELLIGI